MDQSTGRITAMGPRADSPVVREPRGGTNGSEPSHQIEADIARTRVRLRDTIDALERELTPERVVVKSAQWLRASLETPPLPSVRTQAWAYAIPFALIASGLGWLFMVRRSSRARTSSGSGDIADKAVEADDTPGSVCSDGDVADAAVPVPSADERAAI